MFNRFRVLSAESLVKHNVKGGYSQLTVYYKLNVYPIRIYFKELRDCVSYTTHAIDSIDRNGAA